MPDRRARRPVRDSARAGFHPYAKPKEAKEDLRALVRLCVPVQESESALENSHEKDHQLQEAQRPQKMGGRLPIQERAAAENWAELFDPRPWDQAPSHGGIPEHHRLATLASEESIGREKESREEDADELLYALLLWRNEEVLQNLVARLQEIQDEAKDGNTTHAPPQTANVQPNEVCPPGPRRQGEKAIEKRDKEKNANTIWRTIRANRVWKRASQKEDREPGELAGDQDLKGLNLQNEAKNR